MTILKKASHIVKNFVLIVTGLTVLFVIVLFIVPVKIDTLFLTAHPSTTYQESLQRIESLRHRDSEKISPEGRTILMDHGQRMDRVIVFFHGFTNSPRQFEQLGQIFFDQGYNVLIPRIPHHGVIDPNLFDLEELTAEELAQKANEAVDIARGLGQDVTVVGLSMGGVMAGWTAQFRQDVNLTVMIAPNFGTYRLPNAFLKPTINLMNLIRNRFIWWDRELKQDMPRPPTAYVGFSSRALGEIRRLGWSVQKIGQKNAPMAQKILMVTNANDTVVSKEGIDIIVNNWKKQDAKKVKTFEFPFHLNLGHDLIDPEQPNQNIAVVYPQLLSLINPDRDGDSD